MARKCEQALVAAIRAALKGETFKQPGGNTVVQVFHNNPNAKGDEASICLDVSLHGNRIAEFKVVHGEVHARCTLAGYNTVTTRSRVNALCNALGAEWACVTPRRYSPIVGTASGYKSVNSHDWFDIV